MPFDPVSDRAFRIFTEAYAKAWAPKQSPERKRESEPEPPPVVASDVEVVTDIITKSKAWGETPF